MERIAGLHEGTSIGVLITKYLRRVSVYVLHVVLGGWPVLALLDVRLPAIISPLPFLIPILILLLLGFLLILLPCGLFLHDKDRMLACPLVYIIYQVMRIDDPFHRHLITSHICLDRLQQQARKEEEEEDGWGTLYFPDGLLEDLSACLTMHPNLQYDSDRGMGLTT